MPAYDESYLDSMIQKTRYLFKLIARNSENPFQVITNYMEGEYRRHMDEGNPLYLNKTPKQVLESLGVDILEDSKISEKYDEFILEWMADVYTYMQWKYDIFSGEIVCKVKPGELYLKYSPLHEMSLGGVVRKIREIYQV